MKSNVFWNRGNKTVRLNPIITDATIEKSSDSMGTVTLVINKERLKDFKFEIGDNILIPYFNNNSKVLFRGKVFKVSYTNNDEIEITAYDILKYFQGTKYNVFPTTELGNIIKVMCADLAVEYGYLEKTPACPAKLFTDKTYGDILVEYQEFLLYMNGKKYVHRVENNQIALRNLADLMTGYVITDAITTDYSYEESAEDLINVVEITKKNDKTGDYTRYVIGDRESMDKNKLFINNQYKYDLSFSIPGLVLLNVFDVIKTNINGQANMGFIDSISWNLIDETTEIKLSILGK